MSQSIARIQTVHVRGVSAIRRPLIILSVCAIERSAAKAAEPAEKIVVPNHSLLGQLASTTPVVILQIGYAGVLAFVLLAHRNGHRRRS